MPLFPIKRPLENPSAMDIIKAYHDDFLERLPELSGNGKTRTRREEAISAFEASGMPNRRMEGWRYSDLSSLGKRGFESRSAPASGPAFVPDKITDWPRLVFLNGQLVAAESDPVGDLGVDFLETGEALSGHGWTKDLLEHNDADAFENLNMAFAEGGFVLRARKGTKIDGIEILFLFEGEENTVCHVKNMVVLESGAEMSLLISTDSSKNFGWLNLVNQFVIEKNASLDLYTDFSASSNSLLTSSKTISLNGGRFNMHSLVLEANSIRHTITAHIQGEESEISLSGVMLAIGNQTLDILTRINHKIGHSRSKQCFHAVAAKGGKTAFQGQVTVDKDAQKTDASQSSKNILLDARSEANIKPELIINADDVKCSHGATVGELDKDALFYLMQRGLAPDEAQRMLINAFMSEVIEPIRNDKIRQAFGQRLEDRLREVLLETGEL